ncbi:unnamed protein product, partial [Ixodes pacificus]
GRHVPVSAVVEVEPEVGVVSVGARPGRGLAAHAVRRRRGQDSASRCRPFADDGGHRSRSRHEDRARTRAQTRAGPVPEAPLRSRRFPGGGFRRQGTQARAWNREKQLVR